MANPMFCFPVWSDGTESVDTVFSGGSWDATQNLYKLAGDDVNDAAISTNATTGNTWFEVDLGVIRDCRAFIITDHNITNDGLIFVEASDTPQFSGATVGANASIAATTISITAGSTDLDIENDIFFTIEGQDTLYQVDAGNFISAGDTDTITITPALVAGITTGQDITCHSGNYDAPVYTFDAPELAVPRIYPMFSLFWGHPSLWTGQPTNEDRITRKIPVVKTFDALLARFFRCYVIDTANPDGNIRLNRLMIARGIQPTSGMAYNSTTLGIISNTKVATTNSKRRIYNPKRNQRLLQMEIHNITYAESFANYFNMQGSLDIYKQFYMIFDPDDTELMHQRSYAATFRTLNPLQFPYFSVNHIPLEALEVI